jgi:hypothetical protein
MFSTPTGTRESPQAVREGKLPGGHPPNASQKQFTWDPKLVVETKLAEEIHLKRLLKKYEVELNS